MTFLASEMTLKLGSGNKRTFLASKLTFLASEMTFFVSKMARFALFQLWRSNFRTGGHRTSPDERRRRRCRRPEIAKFCI